MTGDAAGKARRRWPRYLMVAIALPGVAFAVAMVVEFTRLRQETTLHHLAGLRSEILLDPQQLRAHAPLDRDFDIAGDGSVLFASRGHLHEAAPGSGEAVALPLQSTLRSFAFDRGGALLTIADGFLGRIDAQGGNVPGVPLPEGEARLSPSRRPGAVYLIVTRDRASRLYRFLEEGDFQVLLASDQPLVAVADDNERIHAATARMIVRLADPEPVVVFLAPDDPQWGAIQSLAVGDDGLLLFSTQHKVYALRDGVALSIVNDSGGMLRMRDERLYVLDDRRSLLYALTPVSVAMFGGER